MLSGGQPVQLLSVLMHNLKVITSDAIDAQRPLVESLLDKNCD
jgi:hypothetical protein